MEQPTQVPIDEFHGMGGSYVVGPDGKRQLVQRTAPPGDVEEDGAEVV